MNRLEFLTSLRYNLEKGGLPREDIEDALSYYEEIFLDSGYGSDEQTANMLGSPEDLARDILIDNGIHPDGDAAYEVGEAKKKPYQNVQDVDFEEVEKENNTHNGYNYDYGYNGQNGQNGNTGAGAGTAFDDMANKFGKAVNSAFDTARSTFDNARNTFDRTFNDPSMTEAQKSRRNNNILKLLIVIFTAPIWIGIIGGIGGALIGLLGALFSGIIALIAGGVSLLVAGIVHLFLCPPQGVMMIGGGLLMLGLFILVGRPLLKGLLKLCKLALDGCKFLWKKIVG